MNNFIVIVIIIVNIFLKYVLGFINNIIIILVIYIPVLVMSSSKSAVPLYPVSPLSTKIIFQSIPAFSVSGQPAKAT